MEVVLCIGAEDFWAYPVLSGKNLAQVIIDNIAASRPVRRLTVVRNQRWVEGVSGRAPLFSLPPQDVLRSTLVWASKDSLEEEVYAAFRVQNIDSAVVITAQTPYIKEFMFSEVFDKTNNAVLFSTSWADLVNKCAIFGKTSFPTDPETLSYIYGELNRGASWDDIVEEFNGQQSSILQ